MVVCNWFLSFCVPDFRVHLFCNTSFREIILHCVILYIPLFSYHLWNMRLLQSSGHVKMALLWTSLCMASVDNFSSLGFVPGIVVGLYDKPVIKFWITACYQQNPFFKFLCFYFIPATLSLFVIEAINWGWEEEKKVLLIFFIGYFKFRQLEVSLQR